MVGEPDYAELGLFCADVCRTLDREMNGKKKDDLSRSAYHAMNLLMT